MKGALSMHEISLHDFLVFLGVAAAGGLILGTFLGVHLAAWVRGELDR